MSGVYTKVAFFSSGKPALRDTVGWSSLLSVLILFTILGYWRNMDYRSEVTLWTSAVRTDPGNPRAYLGLGTSALRAGNYTLAERSLLRAMKLSHRGRDVTLESLNNLAVLEKRRGNTTQSTAYFREILRLAPDHPPSLYNLSLLLIKGWPPGSPEFEEGFSLAGRLQTILPQQDLRMLTLLATRSILKGRTDQAFRYLRQMGSAGLDSPGIVELWGDLLAAADPSLHDAVLRVYQSLGRDPGDLVARAASTLRLKGREDDADRLIQRSLELSQ